MAKEKIILSIIVYVFSSTHIITVKYYNSDLHHKMYQIKHKTFNDCL